MRYIATQTHLDGPCWSVIDTAPARPYEGQPPLSILGVPVPPYRCRSRQEAELQAGELNAVGGLPEDQWIHLNAMGWVFVFPGRERCLAPVEGFKSCGAPAAHLAWTAVIGDEELEIHMCCRHHRGYLAEHLGEEQWP